MWLCRIEFLYKNFQFGSFSFSHATILKEFTMTRHQLLFLVKVLNQQLINDRNSFIALTGADKIKKVTDTIWQNVYIFV